MYLARLICPSGERPAFERTGNVGPRTPLPLDMSPAEQERLLAANMAMKPLSEGEVDHHWIDAYEVVCESQSTTAYMHLYHCSAAGPAQAPTGLRIIRSGRSVGRVGVGGQSGRERGAPHEEIARC